MIAAAVPALPGDAMSWRSTDLDEVRLEGGRIFCDHRLQIAGAGQRLDTRLQHRRHGQLGIGRLGYGATVDIDPQQLDGFYLLQWPRQGGELIELGGERVHSDARTGTLVSPRRRFRMRHLAGTDKRFVRIDEALLSRQFEALAPGGGRLPPPLPAALDFADPRLAPLAGLLRWGLDDAEGPQPLLAQPLIAASFEDLLLRSLLALLAPQRLASPGAALAPRFVRRAEAWMAEHAAEPISAADIALAAGVSLRSLYAGFRRHLDATPMAHLRRIRLARVHAELQQPLHPEDSVTRVALRWGFGHLGQFAADYRARYGEPPSHTLRRARGF